MRLTGAFHFLNLIREINIAEIRDEAEQRFEILVLGRPIEAEAVADRLGATPGRHGLHPWISVHHLPMEAGAEPRLTPDRFTLAIVVTDDVQPSLSEAEAIRRLEGAGVLTVVAVLNDDALRRAGANGARVEDPSRAILSKEPTADDIKLRLAPVLLDALPDGRGLRVAFARRMPVLRETLISAIVDDVARANAMYSMTTGLAEQIPVLNIPLNAADVIVLTKNQLIMAYKIALAAGKRGRPTELMGEIISVLGGGLLFREVARKLVGLVPVIGLVPKVAVSYAGTRVIGTVVERWAMEGHRIRIDEMRSLYDEAMRGGRELAKSLADRIDSDNATADRADDEDVAVNKEAIQTWADEGGALPSVEPPTVSSPDLDAVANANGYIAREREGGASGDVGTRNDGGDAGARGAAGDDDSAGADAEEPDGETGGAAPA